MTEEEIAKVAKICLTADGWCSHCSLDLCRQLQEAFPEYAGVITAIDDHHEDYRCIYREIAEEVWPKDPPKVWEIYL